MSTQSSTRSVTSSDGTRIGYLQEGAGPGIILVQGGMADVHAYRELARELSSSFTVISAERRGRGLSPLPYSAHHDIARDVEDIDAIIAETGATGVFGLSSGAIIALEAARTLDSIERLAVYEPPFYSDGISREGIQRLNRDVEAGALGPALVDALLTAQTAPLVFSRLPRTVAIALARVILLVQGLLPGPASTLRELLPGVRYDFADVAAVEGRMQGFASIRCPVLLLSGTASPRFLRTAIRQLHGVIPGARHIEFPGLGHDGPWNAGSPKEVGAALSHFFAER